MVAWFTHTQNRWIDRKVEPLWVEASPTTVGDNQHIELAIAFCKLGPQIHAILMVDWLRVIEGAIL